MKKIIFNKNQYEFDLYGYNEKINLIKGSIENIEKYMITEDYKKNCIEKAKKLCGSIENDLIFYEKYSEILKKHYVNEILYLI